MINEISPETSSECPNGFDRRFNGRPFINRHAKSAAFVKTRPARNVLRISAQEDTFARIVFQRFVGKTKAAKLAFKQFVSSYSAERKKLTHFGENESICCANLSAHKPVDWPVIRRAGRCPLDCAKQPAAL